MTVSNRFEGEICLLVDTVFFLSMHPKHNLTNKREGIDLIHGGCFFLFMQRQNSWGVNLSGIRAIFPDPKQSVSSTALELSVELFYSGKSGLIEIGPGILSHK